MIVLGFHREEILAIAYNFPIMGENNIVFWRLYGLCTHGVYAHHLVWRVQYLPEG